MDGRTELDLKFQHHIDEKLAIMPAFVDDYYHSIKDKSIKTINSYLAKDIKFFEFVQSNYGIDVNDPYEFVKIKASAIERFMNEAEGETSNKLTYLYAIKDLFRFLLKDEYIEKNPCDRITAPKNKKEVQRTELNEFDIHQIRQNIKDCKVSTNVMEQHKMYTRNILLFDMFITTGLRKSSIIALNYNDIDFVNSQIRIVEKGNKVRYLPVNEQIIEEIYDYEELRNEILIDTNSNTDALFVSRLGKRMAVGTIDKFVYGVTGSIHKKMSPHKLRATCATLLIKKTGNIYLVADRLGHANVETTKRYAHLDDEMREEAIKAMDDIIF